MVRLASLLLFFFAFVPLHAQEDRAQLRDSLKAATELLAYHTDSIELRLRKASWNVRLEQWEYAKAEYDYVIGREPTNIAARYYRAFVNDKLKRYNFARLDYQAVLTLAPGNFEAQLGLALLNQKDSHYTEAIDQINHLVEQFPDSAVAYAARAGIEKERGMSELALYDFSEAIKRCPNDVDYRVSKIDLLLTLKRRQEALEELDELLKLGVARGSLQDFYKRANRI